MTDNHIRYNGKIELNIHTFKKNWIFINLAMVSLLVIFTKNKQKKNIISISTIFYK